MLPKVELSYDKENYLSINNKPVTAINYIKKNIPTVINNNVEVKFSKNWMLIKDAAIIPQQVVENVFYVSKYF